MVRLVDGVLGAKPRERTYEGAVVVRNDLSVSAKLSFRTTCTHRRKVTTSVQVAPGDTYTFEHRPSKHFDFFMAVNVKEGKAHVVRGAKYALRLAGAEGAARSIVVDTVVPPERPKKGRLEKVRELSFGFAGCGFLGIYELGAAQCLSDEGVARNPYFRCAGTSGGALTAFIMMYGVPSMQQLVDNAKQKARDIRADPRHTAGLRKFIIESLATFWRDGSLEHPAFKEGRVEVVFAEAKDEHLWMFLEGCIGRVKKHQTSTFQTLMDAIIALLASSSAYFSGLPFNMPDESTGKDIKVADGLFVDNLPVVDEFSVTLKPFSDGGDILGASGRKADICPTEFVPMRWIAMPPSERTMQHLFELGYRDMEAWLDLHLEDHVEKVRASGKAPAISEELPPVEFVCADDGMRWYDEVLAAVPVKMQEQLGLTKKHASEGSSPDAEAGGDDGSDYQGDDASDCEALLAADEEDSLGDCRSPEEDLKS
uniref:PNPLA domain-containing protein n=1 Tax=Zooxanthella nutricula TaxID=1333877 RepID=A0A6U6JA34_9DINO